MVLILAAIEQVIDARREQQAVFAIQALAVVAVAPGLAVARHQMLDALGTRQPTSRLQLPDALLEHALLFARDRARPTAADGSLRLAESLEGMTIGNLMLTEGTQNDLHSIVNINAVSATSA